MHFHYRQISSDVDNIVEKDKTVRYDRVVETIACWVFFALFCRLLIFF